ncbi:AbrB/MazE/SpoVT family DNA-binding domain-containing protein [Sphingomonas populi]|uniref:AbrB/MazE/SpoVT family DNA-binding domain-containing protein n=1 Tax=Sphingomonas populi TaxID=2484750 RepID=A0A4Q6Y7X6_9SPHN|nr:AbrB/MazE/SpoVT family DNA-binding domain-containing protein [Sphingomonas populi]RZF66144.1 AbrB/MazE/SpoVT family DNA-binding domain-containing protein [Sphingomonas populi]
MNAHAPVDPVETNMTSKGQVLIPKALRERAGLVPNGPVRVGLNDRGEVIIVPPERAETPEERVARVAAAIEAIAGKFKTGFASTDDYMDEIRPWRHDPL